LDYLSDSRTNRFVGGGLLWSFAEMKTAQQSFELLKKRLFTSAYVRYIALIDSYGNTIAGSMKQGVPAVTLPDQDLVMNLQAMVALGIGESNETFAGKLQHMIVRWNKVMDVYFLVRRDLGLAVTVDPDTPQEAISEISEIVAEITK
jgi:hypothetical protein